MFHSTKYGQGPLGALTGRRANRTNLRWSRFLAIASICLATGWIAQAPAAVISVNFEGGYTSHASAALGPSATAGAVAVSHWNDILTPSLTGVSNVTVGVALMDSTGATGVASLTYNVSNTYSAYTAAPSGSDPNAILMDGYFDNFNFNTAGNFVTVSGLGSAFTSHGYQVLVYFNNDAAGSQGYSVTDGTNTDTRYGHQLLANDPARLNSALTGNYPLSPTFIGSTSTNPGDTGNSSNYVILSGMTGSSFTLTGMLGTLGDNRARPNGFQVVSIPEPNSLVLLGLGAVGLLLAIRRGRKV